MGQRSYRLLEWLSRRINVTEVFSLFAAYGLFYAEVDTRKPLLRALAEALVSPVPSYGRWPRVLGLFSLVLIIIEVVTGALLALYYLPTPQGAYDSLLVILQEVHFGWFVHQIHFWGAQVLLVILSVRLLRFCFQNVYRAPRELVWVCAVLLFFVCLHADFTGRFLKWTSVSYWSGVRALETLSAVPVYGWLLSFVIGGADVSELTLIRYYFLHVALIPPMMPVLIYFHFATVRRVGLTDVTRDHTTSGPVFYRNHMATVAVVLALTFGVLSTLAVLFPLPYHGQADPLVTVPGVGPPWYLLAPFGFRELTVGGLPTWVSGTVLLLISLALLGLPFWEVALPRRLRRPLILGLGLAGLAVWLLLSIYGARVA
jgi:quinol-cytochrome oxidoreductase complex cytochrome b subunit